MGLLSEMSTEAIPEILEISASETLASTRPRSASTAAMGRPLDAASESMTEAVSPGIRPPATSASESLLDHSVGVRRSALIRRP